MVEKLQERWVYYRDFEGKPSYRISPCSPEEEQPPLTLYEFLGHYERLTDSQVRDIFYLTIDHKGSKETFISALEKIISQEKKKLVPFDPDLLPNNPQNVEAAEARGWNYDTANEIYRDHDRSPIADQFGQPIG